MPRARGVGSLRSPETAEVFSVPPCIRPTLALASTEDSSRSICSTVASDRGSTERGCSTATVFSDSPEVPAILIVAVSTTSAGAAGCVKETEAALYEETTLATLALEEVHSMLATVFRVFASTTLNGNSNFLTASGMEPWANSAGSSTLSKVRLRYSPTRASSHGN